MDRPSLALFTEVSGKCVFAKYSIPHRLSQAVLRIASHTAPFRGSAIVPTNIILSFPSPEEAPTLIYEGMAQMDLSLAHSRRVRTPRQTQCFLYLCATVLPALVGGPETLLVDSTLFEVLQTTMRSIVGDRATLILPRRNRCTGGGDTRVSE